MGMLEKSIWELELRPHLPSVECEVHKRVSAEEVRLRSAETRLHAIFGFPGYPI